MDEKSSAHDLGKRTGKLARSVKRRALRASEQLQVDRLDLALQTLETIGDDIGNLLVEVRKNGDDR
jgi:hypothetical protein